MLRAIEVPMTQLARKLRVTDYFSLGWGAMIGVGWLVVMDDWLARGGPLGAILGFTIGGALLLPIGYVYGQLVAAMPDAAGEIAYTARAFGSARLSYATGWTMLLAYFIVCPWEAVAIGKIAAFMFPALDRFELYRLAARPVYLPHLALGLVLIAGVGAINYRGIRSSATFQNWITFSVLGLCTLFVSLGAAHGSTTNFPPLFSGSPFLSVVLVLQIVPYFMTGWEAVGKASEEATQEFRPRDFLRAMWAAILVGIVFYTLIVAAVAYAAPWRWLIGGNFVTAMAFERAVGARWIVNFIMGVALLALLKCFNANFVAATRLVFALGRRGLIAPRAGAVHPSNRTPYVAVVGVAVATALSMFLGQAILIPITEVGSVAAALGWLAACASWYRIRTSNRQRVVAAAGIAIAATLVGMKALPFIPGHFSRYEWLALFCWAALGAGLRLAAPAAPVRAATGL
jgi:basic amino acid/polyamine antiporter, APA family